MLEALAPDDLDLRARLGAAAGVDAETGAFEAGSAIVAGTSADIAAVWAPMLEGWTVGTLTAETDRRALAAAARGPAPAAPDLPALLTELAAPGRSLGIATHDGEAAAKAHMDRLGALEKFDFVAGYDSGHGLKPGPGMVLAFCAATGLAPSQVAMIGDSLHDLDAGRAAEAGWVVGVLTGPATEAELAPHADLVLPSIAELPAALEARAAARGG